MRLANDPNSSTRSFKGALDEVYIWNRALTAAEIGQMLTNGLTGLTIDGSQTARAGTFTWTGYASVYWTNTANWSTNAVPGASDIAIFDFSSLNNMATDLGQAQAVAGVNISGPLLSVGIASAGGYPLTLGSAGLALSNTLATVALSAPVRLSAPQTWSVADSAVLTTTSAVTNAGNLLTLINNNTAAFNGVISGSGGLTLGGVGFDNLWRGQYLHRTDGHQRRPTNDRRLPRPGEFAHHHQQRRSAFGRSG